MTAANNRAEAQDAQPSRPDRQTKDRKVPLASWQAERQAIFNRAMKKLVKDPRTSLRSGSTVIADLIYGWANPGWSALDEYLAACVRWALRTRGPILECGAGLSTIVVGAIAKRRGLTLWSLEHAANWIARVEFCLHRYGLDNVVLCATVLKDYGEFVWYDPPLEFMPDDFSLVICDGPPGSIKGGRYGLIPILRGRFSADWTVLLDDAGRRGELAIAERWNAELGMPFNIRGVTKPYIEMTFSNAISRKRKPSRKRGRRIARQRQLLGPEAR
jgi:hypothetical protein